MSEHSAPILDDAQHEAIAGWIAGVRTTFALDGWHIELSRDATSVDGALASVYVHDEADRATFHVSAAWLEADQAERRRLLAHELLHPTLYRVTNLARRLVRGEIGYTAERLFGEAIRLEEEQAIDRLATGLAPLLPLMPEVAGSAALVRDE